jgi:uncharacterized protein
MDGARRKSVDEIGFQIRPGSEEINCCSANAPRGFGMIAQWALMSDGRGLTLNWYGPATMTARLGDVEVVLKQETQYPRDGRIRLEVSPKTPLRFPLKLRIPSWSAKTSVQVNGQPVADVRPGAYLTVDRLWKPGDTLQIDLDMSLHYWVGERECAGKSSIYRGPLLLVHQSTSRPTFDATTIDGRLVNPPGATRPLVMLECQTADGAEVQLRDYGTAGEDGSPYVSWLEVRNVTAAEFSKTNPLRCARPSQKRP